MRKRLLAVTLSVMMTASMLAGCGGKADTKDTKKVQTEQDSSKDALPIWQKNLRKRKMQQKMQDWKMVYILRNFIQTVRCFMQMRQRMEKEL